MTLAADQSSLGTAVCAFLAFSIPAGVFWPYFAGGSALVIGLWQIRKTELDRGQGLDKLTLLGPTFFAIAMAIFGADHLVAAKFVALIVPSWMPGRLFWAYFVGFALIAAALSLTTGIQRRLASALLGLMIFMFALMIHLPNFAQTPHDPVRLTILLRDLCLSAGALAFAASLSNQKPVAGTRWALTTVSSRLIPVTCFLFAIPVAMFGIDHFLDPAFAPGIPQENATVFVTMPRWIPAHTIWAYLTGGIFIVCALGLMTRKHARLTAQVLGLTILVLIVLVYVPLTLAKASDIANGLNYLAIHFALAGDAFLLASAVGGEPGGAGIRDAVAGPDQGAARVTELTRAS
jgi:uncharacterized membrane protein